MSAIARSLARAVPSASRQAVRCYAAAAQEERVNVPLKLYGLSGTYATALYAAATKSKSLDAVEKEFTAIAAATGANEKLAFFLGDPTVPAAEKSGVVDELLTKAKAGEVTRNFFNVLTENGRLQALSGISNDFAELMAAHRKEVKAVVTSAETLSKSDLKEVMKVLEGLVEAGESIKLESKVDPNILGGLVVSVGDRFIDLSVSTRIKQMKNELLQSL